MTVSDTVVRASNLRKVYRLYTKPSYRYLDLLGLLPAGNGYYSERAALNGINLEIKKGEKVCVIGRNGAGKSTLLKLVTNVIQPTSGILEVRAQSRALLQIGTGFHPDFTGRENVLSYLAHLGVTGNDAKKLITEIIDFAELEEYADQPIKSYSTGMAVRLMFAAATVIAPNLLVVDEVLGVGDAYFAHKSFERIRTLCEGLETTLLLVTHDIYNAARLCNRMVWIDFGSIVLDGSPRDVINAYEDSIRRQEERRLRIKQMSALRRPRASKILLELKTPDNRPLNSPVYFSRIALAVEGTVLEELPLANASDEAGTHLIQGQNAWGNPVEWKGRRARPMLNYGTVFHKVAGVFDVTGLLDRLNDFHVEVTCWSQHKATLEATAYLDELEHRLGVFEIVPGEWHVSRTSNGTTGDIRTGSQEIAPTGGTTGSGAVVISEVKVLDKNGNSRLRLNYGEPCSIAVGFSCNNPDTSKAQVVITFHRDGVQDVCRLFAPCLDLQQANHRTGHIVASLPRLMLGTGRYTVTVMITEPGYFESAPVLFYSINPGVFDCWARLFEIEVVEGGVIGTGTGVVANAHWTVTTHL